MEKILIIDDDPDIRQQLKWGLSDEYVVLLAGDAKEGVAGYKKHHPSVVVLDLGLPPHENTSAEGFRALAEILDNNPHAKVVVLTGNSERENALKAIDMGAYDFYLKPPILNELKVIISRAIQLAGIEEQNRSLQRALEMKSMDSGGMIGHCPEMQKIFAIIKKVAPSDVPVLITGENGTGKELVAQALHEFSLRKKGPFIPINCGAIPENLLESEFFGHEKGAFTGAHTTVHGKLQFANKGTLFLDEIGELPVNLQVKLLRFLQEGMVQRVGGRVDIPINTRTVCATNINISQAIKDGKFREDLYYRISVITINLPPLRERKDDVLLLANHFLRLFNEEHKKRVRRFSSSARSFLKNYYWPGNVRELRNRVQRAIIMSDASAIEVLDLGGEVESPELLDEVQPVISLREARERVEKELIANAIDRQNGNIVKAAEELGISRPTLYDLIKKHGLVSINQADRVSDLVQ